MKSAIGIGALLMDGLGDTIRVSLTGTWVGHVCVTCVCGFQCELCFSVLNAGMTPQPLPLS